MPTLAQAATKRIVGYYYGKGRPGYELSQVPVKKLTHLIYSMATPTSSGACELAHPAIDVPNMQALKAFRAKNPQLLILLSVGGWSGSTYFSDLAATVAARTKFARACVQLVKKFDFDGLDIDWEYPVTGGKPTDHKRKSDKSNFVLLLKQIRTSLDASGHGQNLLLTVATTGYRNHLNDLSLKEMANVVDWFNLMGYDFNEMQPNLTSHHSGLFSWSANSILNADAIKYANSDAAVQWYLDQGVSPEKIVLGVPFYGQIWANVPEANDGLYQPYEGRPGEEEDGTVSYRDIHLPVYAYHWDNRVEVPWLYSKKARIMISYEDPESIARKAEYVIQRQLGGMMFWDLGQDDESGTLLETIYRKLVG